MDGREEERHVPQKDMEEMRNLKKPMDVPNHKLETTGIS